MPQLSSLVLGVAQQLDAFGKGDRVLGLGFGVQGLGFRVLGLGLAERGFGV